MKLTTKQLKQMIKEELESVLDENLPRQGTEDYWPILQDCIKSGKSEDECVDLATQVFGGSYDDDTIMDYMKHQYGGEKIAAPQKSETEDINDWIDNNRQWNEFYQYTSDPKVWSWHFGDEPTPKELMRIYKSIFGEFYQGIDPEEASWPGRKLKNKVIKWMKR
jgi:hypothetical protein